MEVKPGEIYWVTITPSQTVGSEQHNRRPYVIVSRLKINRTSPIVVGIPLTTTRADQVQPPHRIQIPANEIVPDALFRGAISNSVALTDQVRALDKKRLETKMGNLSDTALAAVGLGLLYLFDLR